MGDLSGVNEAALLYEEVREKFEATYKAARLDGDSPPDARWAALMALASARRREPCPTCSGAGCSSWVQGGVRYMSGDIPCPDCDNGTVEVPLLVALARENAATAEARQ